VAVDLIERGREHEIAEANPKVSVIT